MTRVKLLAAGGTIATRSGARGRFVGLSGRELVSAIKVPPGVTLDVTDIASSTSFAMTPQDMTSTLREIRRAIHEGYDGVVVAQGTDSMEEIAFLADLVHVDRRPVVFTGAQRPADDPSSDGPKNLRDAINVAASRPAHGLGVLICFDGLVLPARGTTKIDTDSSRAFEAIGRGPLLRVFADEIRQIARPQRHPHMTFDTSKTDMPRVEVVSLYVGADRHLIDRIVQGYPKVDGLVLACFGAGNANESVTAAVYEAISLRKIPILASSRVANGAVAPLYLGGGGADLEQAGVIFADDLSPWQARILLMAALASNPANLRQAIRNYLHPESETKDPTLENSVSQSKEPLA